MNIEQIKELAIEAGDDWEQTLKEDREFLEKFAALVAAAEREACAKVCEEAIKLIFEFSDEIVKETALNVCTNLAKGIRARGNE